MKLLCIDARDTDDTLVEGRLYTKTGQEICKCGTTRYYLAEELQPNILWCCRDCREERRGPPGWFSWRFTPFRPDQFGITEEDVRKLYQPGLKPIKEKQDESCQRRNH